MSLLSTDAFREHEATPLPDSALQLLIDAAEQTITARMGGLTALEDRRRGGGILLFLSRRVATITSVTERYGDPLGLTDILLDTSDWTLMPDRQTLRREWIGTHRVDRWADDVIVVYTPFDDTLERQRVAIALVKLDLAHHPRLVSETVGPWTETYLKNSTEDYMLEREAILSTLTSGLGFA